MGDKRGSDTTPKGGLDKSDLFGSKWEARLEEARARRAAALSDRPKQVPAQQATPLPDQQTGELPQLFDEETGAPGKRPDIGLLGLTPKSGLDPLERANSDLKEKSEDVSATDLGAAAALASVVDGSAGSAKPNAARTSTPASRGEPGRDLVLREEEENRKGAAWLVPVGLAASVAALAYGGFWAYGNVEARGSGSDISAFGRSETPTVAEAVPVVIADAPTRREPEALDGNVAIATGAGAAPNRAPLPGLGVPLAQPDYMVADRLVRTASSSATLDVEVVARALEAGGDVSPDAVVGALDSGPSDLDLGPFERGREAAAALAALLQSEETPGAAQDLDTQSASLGSELAPTRSPLPQFRPKSIEALTLGEPNEVWTDMRAGADGTADTGSQPDLQVASIAPVTPQLVETAQPGHTLQDAGWTGGDAILPNQQRSPVVALIDGPEGGVLEPAETTFDLPLSSVQIVALTPAAGSLPEVGQELDNRPNVATLPTLQRAPFEPWTEVVGALSRARPDPETHGLTVAALAPVTAGVTVARREEPNANGGAFPTLETASALQRAPVTPWLGVRPTHSASRLDAEAASVAFASIAPIEVNGAAAPIVASEEAAETLPQISTETALQRSNIEVWSGAEVLGLQTQPPVQLAAVGLIGELDAPGQGLSPERLGALSGPEAAPGVTAAPPEPIATVPGATLFIHAAVAEDAGAVDQLATDLRQSVQAEIKLAQPYDFKISRTQVRFFHAEDRAQAEEVAGLISARLRDFTRFETPPAVGTIEIWLAGRGAVEVAAPAAAPEPAPAPAQPAAAAQPRRPQTVRQELPKPKISTSTMTRRRPSTVGRILGGG